MQWYTTWIAEVGFGHWGRSGLVGGDGDGEDDTTAIFGTT